MKYIVLFSLLLIVGFFIYLRLRPYINTARKIFGTVRAMRTISERMSSPQSRVPHGNGRRPERATASAQQLVRCVSCGTWLPASRAIKAGANSSTIYCSRECLEGVATKRA